MQINSKYTDLLLKIASYLLILPALVVLAVIARFWRKTRLSSRTGKRLRLVWAGVPLYSLVAASNAMSAAGYSSISIANDRYPSTRPQDFDIVIKPAYRLPFGLNTIWVTILASLRFVGIMFTRDVLHGFFNGALLGRTPLIDYEYLLWKLSGGKLVLMPYGSDSFVYSQLPDCDWANALRETYPHNLAQDQLIASRLKRFSNFADWVIGCIVHDICLPGTDTTTVLWYPANLDNKTCPPSNASQPLRIAHASNHDALKGTHALVTAVGELKAEGIQINLDLIFGVSRSQVLERFRKADIVVDQLLFGYALAALEAMSLGKPVISGISNDKMYETFREVSYLNEAPIISANTDTIKSILKDLAEHKERLPQLGQATRQYVEKYHSPASTVKIFEEIYENF